MSPAPGTFEPPASATAAAGWLPLARAMAIASCVVAFLLLIAWVVVARSAPEGGWQALTGALGLVGAASLATTGAWFTTWRLLAARALVDQAVASERRAAEQRAQGKSSLFAEVSGKVEIQARLDALVRLGGWRQGLVPGGFLLLALGMLAECRPHAGAIPEAVTCAVVLLVIAFPLLLIERRLSLAAAEEFPDAPALAGLLRWQIAAGVTGAVLLLARSYAPELTLWAERIADGVLALALLELLARVAALAFLPSPTPATAALATDSLLARLLPWPGERRREQDVLRSRFNIDLSRSWSLLLIRRLSGPVVLALAVLCWLLSGLTILPIDRRGVYERMGRPVAVLQPGLHVHLPWPFGIIHTVERGILHEAALGDAEPESKAAAAPVHADDPAPESYDRLWGTAHRFEATYLVPSTAAVATDSNQNFKMVDSDVRIFYRVGLDDAHAVDAAYRIDGSEILVPAIANHLLLSIFSTLPLWSAVPAGTGPAGASMMEIRAADLKGLSETLRQGLQRQLDRHHSGLEVTAVVIDAIHPPPATATAYEDVQVAEIDSQTEVFSAQRDAVQARCDALGDFANTVDQSRAEAREQVSKAQVRRFAFEADDLAFQRYSAALRLERWLETVTDALKKCKLIIVDHRLDLPEGVFLDLRSKE